LLFNSLDFAIFLPAVFILYWFVFSRNLRWQNMLLVVASYFFYGWWDWRFLFLILFSSLLDFTIGLQMAKAKKSSQRKLLLWTSIAVNLGFLGVFKYYNFFVESFVEAFTLMGSSIRPSSLDIILPVGISFYTFQTLSYTIDVYRRKLEPTGDIVSFFAFVSFFPQLVAGPIERATNLLPQFYTSRNFNYSLAVDGCRQILWGLFKKVVIADQCAHYANDIFNNSDSYSGSTLFMGALFFTFQIYGDFSGYSDIAIGTSRLFGFDLKKNFATPYFSRNIAEFWRRWHISLSTWFRDYVYIPLGGSKGSLWMKLRNVFIIFLVSGLWHGANWTFVIWGLLNALYFVPLMLVKRNRSYLGVVAVNSRFPTLRELTSMSLTFLLTVFAWIFFRADSVLGALRFIQGIFTRNLMHLPEVRPSYLIALLFVFVLLEWSGRREDHTLERLWVAKPRGLRWAFYMVLAAMILVFSNEEPQPFIYFQF